MVLPLRIFGQWRLAAVRIGEGRCLVHGVVGSSSYVMMVVVGTLSGVSALSSGETSGVVSDGTVRTLRGTSGSGWLVHGVVGLS